MHFNEPKLLKSVAGAPRRGRERRFSALQRAEIAEIDAYTTVSVKLSFSALQRAEIAEILLTILTRAREVSFSALQRAEIAEIRLARVRRGRAAAFQCSSTSRNC